VDQQVRIADLDLDVSFAGGEEMLTEISTKFSPEALRTELQASGFAVDSQWPSVGDEFLVTLATPVG
jgi:L-histidine N-alpha-methyltransferase